MFKAVRQRSNEKNKMFQGLHGREYPHVKKKKKRKVASKPKSTLAFETPKFFRRK